MLLHKTANRARGQQPLAAAPITPERQSKIIPRWLRTGNIMATTAMTNRLWKMRRTMKASMEEFISVLFKAPEGFG